MSVTRLKVKLDWIASLATLFVPCLSISSSSNRAMTSHSAYRRSSSNA